MLPTTSDPPMCTLKELKDGTYDLADVALMNDWLLVCADNQLIAREMKEAERNGR
jgi:hypothetical protein